MKTLKVEWTGIRPLVMSNPQTVDVANPYAKESRRLNSALKKARKKEDEDLLLELSVKQKRNDFAASAYWSEADQKFFLPDTVIMAAIKEAARSLKKGKDIDRAAFMEETEALITNVPQAKSLEQAYEIPELHLETPAKIPPRTGALMWKVRCMMPTGWTVRFSLTYDETMIAARTMLEILETAGLMCGVGGWRPKFGRFTVETEDAA